MRSAWKVVSNRTANKTVPDPVADPVWTKQRGQGGRPTATHHHGYRQRTLPRLLMAAAAPAMTWLPLNVGIVDNDRGDSPSLISRALAQGWCSGGVPRYRLNTCKVAAVARDVLLSQSARGGMTRC